MKIRAKNIKKYFIPLIQLHQINVNNNYEMTAQELVFIQKTFKAVDDKAVQ